MRGFSIRADRLEDPGALRRLGLHPTRHNANVPRERIRRACLETGRANKFVDILQRQAQHVRTPSHG